MEKGFIQLIVIIVLSIIIVSLLGISLGELFQNQVLKDNFSITFKALNYVWNNFLAAPAVYVWHTLVSFVLDPISKFFQK
ncbi:hypothetical protein HYW53_03960 [Candidatus Giovannonibacteria bacterium]|nr:hypothetical protein [Candidatus Giovannonibacteria bacterium]